MSGSSIVPDLIQPLVNTADVEAFPLPKQLKSLPLTSLQSFINDPELVEGYVHQLSKYKQTVDKVSSTLQQLKQILNNEINENLVIKYKELSNKIEDQIKTITTMSKEFSSLETLQYQLFSSNFNQDFLKHKMKKLIDKTNSQSIEIGKNLKKATTEEEFNNLVSQYKDCRMKYHFRKEKLNRWEEERVSGFL